MANHYNGLRLLGYAVMALVTACGTADNEATEAGNEAQPLQLGAINPLHRSSIALSAFADEASLVGSGIALAEDATLATIYEPKGCSNVKFGKYKGIELCLYASTSNSLSVKGTFHNGTAYDLVNAGWFTTTGAASSCSRTTTAAGATSTCLRTLPSHGYWQAEVDFEGYTIYSPTTKL